MLIKFLETTRYESEGRNKGPLYEEGEIHDLREDLAQRWIRRGLAVPTDALPGGEHGAQNGSPKTPETSDELDDKSFPEVKELAIAAGITVGFGASKAKLIAALRAKS